VPAYVRNGRLDIMSANRLGTALYPEMFADPVRPANMARFIFLNPCAGDFFADGQGIANDAVAILRAEAGRDPYDRRLSDLVGELSTRSEDFRVRWAAHNVKLGCTYVKTLHHPLVGDLTLTYEPLHLPNDPGQRIFVYTAEPDRSHRKRSTSSPAGPPPPTRPSGPSASNAPKAHQLGRKEVWPHAGGRLDAATGPSHLGGAASKPSLLVS
jgi:MmyB-like transcription regulator ligand binding domain